MGDLYARSESATGTTAHGALILNGPRGIVPTRLLRNDLKPRFDGAFFEGLSVGGKAPGATAGASSPSDIRQDGPPSAGEGQFYLLTTFRLGRLDTRLRSSRWAAFPPVCWCYPSGASSSFPLPHTPRKHLRPRRVDRAEPFGCCVLLLEGSRGPAPHRGKRYFRSPVGYLRFDRAK